LTETHGALAKIGFPHEEATTKYWVEMISPQEGVH